MIDLQIRQVENGFIVRESSSMSVGREWAFNTPSELGGFIESWGRGEHDDKSIQKAT